jgi:hypothetical protein
MAPVFTEGDFRVICFTLIESCGIVVLRDCMLRNGKPQQYLGDVLIRIQTHPQSKIADLHPNNWISLRIVRKFGNIERYH